MLNLISSILIPAAMAAVGNVPPIELGFDPETQSFKKMTITYREFQGPNKTAYKLEEITKNGDGRVTAHNYYDEKGTLLAGSFSLVYDNNGNIKTKKMSEFDKAKNKVNTFSYNYANTFEKGFLKKTIITCTDNKDVHDTIDYVRTPGGVLTEKRFGNGIDRTITIYNSDGQVEKESIFKKGKLVVSKNIAYNKNGINLVNGTDATGKNILTHSYAYNEKGKLVKVDRTSSLDGEDFHSNYIYNKAGQLASEERTVQGEKTTIVYEYVAGAGTIDKISVKNSQAIRQNERAYSYE